jgi:hypothetical protein
VTIDGALTFDWALDRASGLPTVMLPEGPRPPDRNDLLTTANRKAPPAVMAPTRLDSQKAWRGLSPSLPSGAWGSLSFAHTMLIATTVDVHCLGIGAAEVACIEGSGGRDSNPRQPAWKACYRVPEGISISLTYRHLAAYRGTCLGDNQL